MIVDGIAYTFGVFLNEFVTHFDEGPGKVAWVGSLLSGMYLTAGMKFFSKHCSFYCELKIFYLKVLLYLDYVISLDVELYALLEVF